jgi:Ca2+-binding EF-hand superfamily protein
VDACEEIAADKLHDALQGAGVNLSQEEVKVLIKHADTDRNGKLSKQEWIRAARAATKGP